MEELEDGPHSTSSGSTKGVCSSSESLLNNLMNYDKTLTQLLSRKKTRKRAQEKTKSSKKKTESVRSSAGLSIPQAALDYMKGVKVEKFQNKLFMENFHWETMDVIKYLSSKHPTRNNEKTSSPSLNETSGVRSPLILMASTKTWRKSTAGRKSHRKSRSLKHNTSSRSSGKSKKALVLPPNYKPTYMLSDPEYIKKEWTKVPDSSITCKIVTLGAVPAILDMWPFRDFTWSKVDYYPNTKMLAGNFDGGFPYCIYYPNGEVAITINNGRAGPRMIIYSMSHKSVSGSWVPSRPQAMFDNLGNGVVYDLNGRMKVNYDQIEGGLYHNNFKDRTMLHWYWKECIYLKYRRMDLGDLPADKNDDIDPIHPEDSLNPKSSKSSSKRSRRSRRQSQKSGRKKSLKKETTSSSQSKKTSQSFKTEKGSSKNGNKRGSTRKGVQKKRGKKKKHKRKLSKKSESPPLRLKPLHPQPIIEFCPIAIKITDYISMRIVNQEHIHIDFSCGGVHYRFYVGVVIQPGTVERIDKVVEPKKVSNVAPCYFELMPLRSLSLFKFNQSLKAMRKKAVNKAARTKLGTFYGNIKKKIVTFNGFPKIK